MSYSRLAALCVMIIFFGSCKEEKVNYITMELNEVLTSDLDQSMDTLDVFHSDSHNVMKVGRNGSNGLRLIGPSEFGFTIKVKVSKGEYYHASVWKRSKRDEGLIIISSENKGLYYDRSKSSNTDEKWPVETDGEWYKVNLELFVNEEIDNEVISFFVWNPSGDTVFFDDFQLIRTQKSYPSGFDEEPVRLQIGKSKMQRLEAVRSRAFANKILEVQESDWVKGILFWNDDMNKVRMRLKGDWLDHLHGSKWSFRLKTKKDYSWKGMRTFSLQTPTARGYLKEWLVHQVLLSEDILSPRYDFVPVELNQKSLGIYAYEEHFDKHIIESNSRREGPILKFSEEALWSLIKNDGVHVNGEMPYFDASVIRPFRSNSTINDTGLRSQFLVGQNLMHQWINQHTPMSDIFDLTKMARLAALSDLFMGRHGLMWHNMRFYYNPVTSKLEPIGFDMCNNEESDFLFYTDEFIGNYFLEDVKRVKHNVGLYALFSDSAFAKMYIADLKEVSSPAYIKALHNIYGERMKEREQWLRIEFPSYSYNWDVLEHRAERMRENISGYESMVESWFKQGAHSFQFERDSLSDRSDKELLIHYLNCYTSSESGNAKQIQYLNFFTGSFRIIGSGANERYIDTWFDEELKVQGYTYDHTDQGSFNVPLSSKFIFCLVGNDEEPVSVPIIPWPTPKDYNPREEIRQDFSILHNENFEIKNGIATPRSKNLLLKEPLYIPSNVRLKLTAGTQINMINASFIVSESAVEFTGDPDQKVVLESSDRSSMGLTILQAKDESTLEYVHFKNLSALNFQGWTLMGAVNFYESDVEILNCKFNDNKSEDGLNIIRSNFKLLKSEFTNVLSDAFDSDFSSGIVQACTFINCGNDAIDLSGSEVVIDQVSMRYISDKSVSAGEGSRVSIKSASVDGTEIAFASKDNSEMVLKGAKVNNATFGFVLLQKKPEYGPASIKSENVIFNGVQTESMIEKGSVLELDGKMIYGNLEGLGETFYSN